MRQSPFLHVGATAIFLDPHAPEFLARRSYLGIPVSFTVSGPYPYFPPITDSYSGTAEVMNMSMFLSARFSHDERSSLIIPCWRNMKSCLYRSFRNFPSAPNGSVTLLSAWDDMIFPAVRNFSLYQKESVSRHLPAAFILLKSGDLLESAKYGLTPGTGWATRYLKNSSPLSPAVESLSDIIHVSFLPRSSWIHAAALYIRTSGKPEDRAFRIQPDSFFSINFRLMFRTIMRSFRFSMMLSPVLRYPPLVSMFILHVPSRPIDTRVGSAPL